MAASVQVLCPNGRRQNVKITANTKLLQVLEEVCKKQGFVPPEDYILKHGRNQVDLSLSIRFAGLSNNAKLELVKSSVSRQEQDVIIALQLETGKRIQGTFLPSVTLWDILLNFEEKNSECSGQLTKAPDKQGDLQPVCIFMQEQVVGEPALRATTLKKLGLTSGKAIIRLLHRPMEDAVMADICEKVEKAKAKQTRLNEIAGKKQLEIKERGRQEVQEETPESTLASRTSDRSSGTAPADSQKLQESSSKESSDKSSKMEVSKEPSAQNVCESSSSQRVEESMEEDTASESATKSDSLPRSGFSGQLAREDSSSQGGASSNPIDDLRNLNIPGLEIFTPDDFRDLSPQEQVIAQRLARRFLPHLQATTVVTDPSGLESHQKKESRESFANFKFPEETKGKDLSAFHHLSQGEKDSEPCERQLVIYNASESLNSSGNSQEELPEDFFEVTQADVRKMYRDLQKTVQNLEEQPLLTQAMREIKAEAACDKYEKVVIRVHFPDKLVLQAFFKPRETVKTLYAFVRDCLQDKKCKFYLYTTPPRTVLERNESTLVSNNLFPASLVYFGVEEINETSSYLEDRLKDQAVSRLEAETVVAKVRQSHDEKTESTGSLADPQPGPSGTQRKIVTAARSSTSSSSSATSGVPKWLKLSKK